MSAGKSALLYTSGSEGQGTLGSALCTGWVSSLWTGPANVDSLGVEPGVHSSGLWPALSGPLGVFGVETDTSCCLRSLCWGCGLWLELGAGRPQVLGGIQSLPLDLASVI